jgi:hypothetical protein
MWLGSTTLQEQYLALYNIVRHKGDTLAKVMETSSPTMMFRCHLIGPRLASWNELVQRLAYRGSEEFPWVLPGMVYFL